MSIDVMPGRAAAAGRLFEKGVGIVTASLFALLVMMAGGATVVVGIDEHLAPAIDVTVRVAAAVLVALEVALICCLLAFRGLDPFAPRFALRLGRMPPAVRPLAVLWWLAHFAVTTAAALFVEGSFAAADAGQHAFGRYGWVVQVAAFVGVGATIAFASNLYAVSAVAAAGCGERAVAAVWRWRITLDVAIAVTATLSAGLLAEQMRPETVTRRPHLAQPVTAASTRPTTAAAGSPRR